jgi:hypothetical protein
MLPCGGLVPDAGFPVGILKIELVEQEQQQTRKPEREKARKKKRTHWASIRADYR